MRVLLVITRGDSIGGAQLYLRELAQQLQNDQHEVLVVTGTAGKLNLLLAEDGVPTTMCGNLRRQIHPLHDVKAIRSLGRIIRAFKPDVVSAHSSKAGVIARIASKLNGVPCIFTAHGWAFAEGIPQPSRTLWQIIERVMAPLAAYIVCVSHKDQNLALQLGFDARRLVTIHNGIPERPSNPGVNRDPNLPVRIVMVARLSTQKDHASVIRAVQTISRCEVHFIGDGPLLESLQDEARILGIGHLVHFHGYRPDVSSFLDEADIFVLSSHYEGFPLTTLEAMRAGLPTIVSDVGGAGEAVVNGVTGFVVPSGDVEALRDRIQYLVDRPLLRSAMGQFGRQVYQNRFTFKRMYKSTERLYLDVANRKAAAPGRRSPGAFNARSARERHVTESQLLAPAATWQNGQGNNELASEDTMQSRRTLVTSGSRKWD
jgi:glycosyltransferase involved in cell wall biosynthesis